MIPSKSKGFLGGVQTIVPLVAALGFGSVLLGYASGNVLRVVPSARTVIAQDDDTGVKTPTTNSDENLPSKADPVEDYKTALALIQKSYYGKTVDAKEKRKLTYEAIRGMLFSLKDPFTGFLDPDEWTQMQSTTRGNFEGIGAQLQQEGAEVKVVEPFENSPAENAGLKPDDIIVRVESQPTLGKNINEVVKLIKGKAGTQVHITVLRNKQEKTFTITRARVEAPVVKHYMQDTDAKIGYIRLTEFNEKSVEQLTLAFNDLKKQGMKGLVFDLRGNPGGLLDTAIHVASMFIQRDSQPDLNNVVVHIREGSGVNKQHRLRSADYLLDNIPLALVVNEGSASASEIVSGAIKDYGVGMLFGERTYGKGRVQTLYPLPDDSALRLTTALYFPPKKVDINYKHDDDGNRIPNTGGVLPDVTLEQTETWKGFRDRAGDIQLNTATSFLRSVLKGKSVKDALQEVTKDLPKPVKKVADKGSNVSRP